MCRAWKPCDKLTHRQVKSVAKLSVLKVHTKRGTMDIQYTTLVNLRRLRLIPGLSDDLKGRRKHSCWVATAPPRGTLADQAHASSYGLVWRVVHTFDPKRETLSDIRTRSFATVCQIFGGPKGQIGLQCTCCRTFNGFPTILWHYAESMSSLGRKEARIVKH